MSFVCKFLNFLNSVKTYHWQTTSYARHLVTNDLYEKFAKQMDDFVETYYGRYPGRPSFTEEDVITLEDCTDEHAERNLKDFVDYLNNELAATIPDDVDLLHIRDDMLQTVNHALYMFSFA